MTKQRNKKNKRKSKISKTLMEESLSQFLMTNQTASSLTGPSLYLMAPWTMYSS
jgi:hypothetical protein